MTPTAGWATGWTQANLIALPRVVFAHVAADVVADGLNRQRLHTAIGRIPPAEHETNYYAQQQP